MMEQTICKECQASSEPILQENFIFCFQAAELINESKLLRDPTTIKQKSTKRKLKGFAIKLFGFSSNSTNSDDGISAEEFNEASVFGELLHKCMEVIILCCLVIIYGIIVYNLRYVHTVQYFDIVANCKHNVCY